MENSFVTGEKHGINTTYSLLTFRRRLLCDLKMLTTSPCVASPRYNPLILKISSPACKKNSTNNVQINTEN